MIKPRPSARTISNNARTRAKLIKASSICRDFQHAWEPHDGGQEGKGWFRTLKCYRCETLRTDHIDEYGDYVGGKQYRYPEGYLIPGGRLTASERAVIRLAHKSSWAQQWES